MEKRMTFWKTVLRRAVCAGLAAVLLLSGSAFGAAATAETLPQTQSPEEEKAWKGFDFAAHSHEVSTKIAIQVGDTGFNQLGFSQVQSDRYIESISKFADEMAQLGIRVISAPAPTSVGVMIEEQYLPQIRCASQKDMQAYLHNGMSENVVKVDVFSNLLEHNDEYLFFRTDHHWTALGGYYAYDALCKALELETVPLDKFTEWDQGKFTGSLYGRVCYPNRLRADNLVAYVPPGDILMTVYRKNHNIGQEHPVVADFTMFDPGSKYSAFLSGESVLTVLENRSMEEGPSCIVVKDSFGNCYVPFLSKTYRRVYAIDYRKFGIMQLSYLCTTKEVDEIIVMPYLIATQSIQGNDIFMKQLR